MICYETEAYTGDTYWKLKIDQCSRQYDHANFVSKNFLVRKLDTSYVTKMMTNLLVNFMPDVEVDISVGGGLIMSYELSENYLS